MSDYTCVNRLIVTGDKDYRSMVKVRDYVDKSAVLPLKDHLLLHNPPEIVSNPRVYCPNPVLSPCLSGPEASANKLALLT